jgi:hypothetical protein
MDFKEDKIREKCRKSNIGSMTPIMNPITEYYTVQQSLITSMEVTNRLNQEFTFVTFDLAAARIAYDIVWSNPQKFKNVVIHLGAFHIMCPYMGAIGKMMAGSGFEEVVIEAGVCASGSINQVMSGKHFNRAVRVHQHVLDAVTRLLLESFCSHYAVDITCLSEVQMLAENPSYKALCVAESGEGWADFLQQFKEYQAMSVKVNMVRQLSFGCIIVTAWGYCCAFRGQLRK